jgi:hypothetical protein
MSIEALVTGCVGALGYFFIFAATPATVSIIFCALNGFRIMPCMPDFTASDKCPYRDSLSPAIFWYQATYL